MAEFILGIAHHRSVRGEFGQLVPDRLSLGWSTAAT